MEQREIEKQIKELEEGIAWNLKQAKTYPEREKYFLDDNEIINKEIFILKSTLTPPSTTN